MRSSPLDVARRAFLGMVRGTVEATDDATRIQSMSVRLLNNELITGVERFQEYGFSSVPPPPDRNGGAAEVAVGFLSGNRSHPIILATDDRRTRPKKGEPGQSALWHYKGHGIKLTASGYSYDAGSEKKPHTTAVGQGVATVADDKVWMRHGGKDGPAVVLKDGIAYLGGDPDEGGTFDFVVTVSGPSTTVKAKL